MEFPIGLGKKRGGGRGRFTPLDDEPDTEGAKRGIGMENVV